MNTRREMLIKMGYASAGIALLGFTPVLSGIDAYASPIGFASFDAFIDAVEAEFGDGNFEFVGETQLMGAQAALLELHRLHGLNQLFSNRVGYAEASQCEDNFRGCEQDWRRANLNYFTDVQRSKQDNDIAYLLGAQYNQYTKNWSQFYGATQFEDLPAVRLAGDEPGVIAAAAALFDQQYQPRPRETAQSATVMSAPQAVVTREGGFIGKVYSTPKTEIIHYPAPVRRGRRGYNKGIVAVRPKNRPTEKWKFAGLYV